MLDVAYYLNDEKKFAQSDLIVEENCAPHYDPGIISLSLLSTHRGLELYNPVNGQWIPHTGEDRSCAVLWCGQTALEASHGLLRPAVHRVIRQLDKPRMAIWYEICTAHQVPPSSRSFLNNLILQHTKAQNSPKDSEQIVIKTPLNKKETTSRKDEIPQEENPTTTTPKEKKNIKNEKDLKNKKNFPITRKELMTTTLKEEGEFL
jgi:isopenicillin N synthase-like dioxygenase